VRSIAICLLFITGCSNNNSLERYAPIYDLYDGAPIEVITIDESNLINVYKQDYQTIKAPQGATYDVGLGNWLSVHGESLFIVDFEKKGINQFDIQSGEHLAHYQFEGSGPGEYRNISYYFSNDNSHFIVDTSLGKIVQYNMDWDHERDIIFEDNYSHPFNNFAYSGNNFYYLSASNEIFLVNKLNISNSADSVQAFHSRVIPIGKQPVQYNYIYMDSNDGELAIVNPAMPFIFLYDREHQIEQMLQIRFPGLDGITSNVELSNTQRGGIVSNEPVILNPPPIAVETDKRISMDYFIIDILHLNNRIAVYYANKHADLRFLTVLKKEKNEWAHEGSYRFFKDDDTLFTIFSMTYREPWLYLAGMFEENIIRVNLDELSQK